MSCQQAGTVEHTSVLRGEQYNTHREDWQPPHLSKRPPKTHKRWNKQQLNQLVLPRYLCVCICLFVFVCLYLSICICVFVFVQVEVLGIMLFSFYGGSDPSWAPSYDTYAYFRFHNSKFKWQIQTNATLPFQKLHPFSLRL